MSSSIENSRPVVRSRLDLTRAAFVASGLLVSILLLLPVASAKAVVFRVTPKNTQPLLLFSVEKRESPEGRRFRVAVTSKPKGRRIARFEARLIVVHQGIVQSSKVVCKPCGAKTRIYRFQIPGWQTHAAKLELIQYARSQSGKPMPAADIFRVHLADYVPDDDWVRTIDVGFHLLHTQTAVSLSKTRAARFFTTTGFDAKAWLKRTRTNIKRVAMRGRKAVERDYQKRAVKRRFWPRHVAMAAIKPRARVVHLSKKEVVVSIRIETSARRWHHFLYELKRYRLRRTPRIDAALKLRALYKKLSFRYRGIGHGSLLDRKALKLLGPYREYMGQSFSYRELYFKKHRLYVNLRHGIVYYVAHRKDPGWPSSMIRR
jgi:hypothetical protein